MATTPNKDENPIRPDQSDVVQTDLPDVGPSADPAKIKRAKHATEALELIAEAGAPFLSRGDDSGTNIKELDLWEDAGINPKGKGWYFESGKNMSDTLVMASRQGSYTLTDIGTFLHMEKKLDLKVLFKGDPLLKNLYSVIAVNPDRYPKARYREAMDFIAFVTSPEGQKLIAGYKKHGTSLFTPEAITSASVKRKK